MNKFTKATIFSRVLAGILLLALVSTILPSDAQTVTDDDTEEFWQLIMRREAAMSSSVTDPERCLDLAIDLALIAGSAEGSILPEYYGEFMAGIAMLAYHCVPELTISPLLCDRYGSIVNVDAGHACDMLDDVIEIFDGETEFVQKWNRIDGWILPDVTIGTVTAVLPPYREALNRRAGWFLINPELSFIGDQLD